MIAVSDELVFGFVIVVLVVLVVFVVVAVVVKIQMIAVAGACVLLCRPARH